MDQAMEKVRPAVNLYIEIEAHGPKRQDGAYGWVLEFIRSDGSPDPRTLNGIGVREDTIDRALVMEAIVEALGRLRTACDVKIYVGPDWYMREAFPAPWRNGWIERWKAEGWTNAKGKPIANADLWKKCDAALCSNSAVFAKKSEKNPYKGWILTEIKRAVWSKINDSAILENRETAKNGNFIKFEQGSME